MHFVYVSTLVISITLTAEVALGGCQAITEGNFLLVIGDGMRMGGKDKVEHQVSKFVMIIMGMVGMSAK